MEEQPRNQGEQAETERGFQEEAGASPARQQPDGGGGPSRADQRPATEQQPAPSPAGSASGERAGRDGDGGASREGVPGGPGGVAEPLGTGDRPGLVDWVFGVIFTPRATFARLAALDRPPLGMLLTVAILITAVSGLVQGTAAVRELALPVAPGESPLLPPDLARNPGVNLALGVLVAILGVVMMFVGAGFLHLVADLAGGRGSGVHLLAAMALASLPPNLIGIPLEALAARLGSAGSALRDASALAMGIWSLILTYRALRATKHLSRGDALIVLFVPVLAFLGLAVLAVLVIAGAAVVAGAAAP